MELSHIVKFYEEAHLDETRQKIYSVRRTKQMYANIMISDCQNESWWYKDFIGVECFVILHFKTYNFGDIKKTFLNLN